MRPTLSSWFPVCPTLTVAAIWGTNQQMGGFFLLPLSPSANEEKMNQGFEKFQFSNFLNHISHICILNLKYFFKN